MARVSWEMRRMGPALVALVVAACDGGGGTPKSSATAWSSTKDGAGVATGVASGVANGVANGAMSGTAASTANAAPTATAPARPEPPPLVDEDGKTLPQTEDLPKIDDPLFVYRLQLLWQAIVKDDAEIARELFFPVQAYEQVKGIKDPAKDWEHRLFKAFKRNVHEYHQRLGDDRAQARFLRIELRNEPKWMEPGSEGNVIGYHRVTRSYIHYETADGEARHFDLTSMISWRGQWYVVHLHGFK